MESNSQPSETMLPLKRFDKSRHYDQDDDNSSVSSTYEQGSHSSAESHSTASTSLRSANTAQKQQLKPIVIQKDKDMAATFGYQFKKDEDPRSSAETYNSVFSEESESQDEDDESDHQTILPTDDDIPAVLPQYRASIVDPFVRPSTPDAFGRLFPSMDRLSIRHDDLTPDGNMNLRVDTVVPGRNGRRPLTVQLFHLRMHDLGRREFSLRRYCRDSGREVCNSKRAYAEPGPTTRPGLQRSFSSVMRSVKGLPFRGPNHPSQSQQGKGLPGNGSASSWDAMSLRSMRIRRDSWTSDKPVPSASCLVPTNTIKLEFSNYARVDVSRNSRRKVHHYDFEWWGHKYSWKRVVDKDLNVASYHLMRDGHGMAVAHITPEMRSPNQIEEDEWAGGWIPPCHMWISDPSIVNAATDVADVIVATGLICLVDDCIKNRWHAKKQPKMARSKSNDLTHTRRRSLVQDILHRRHSEQHRRLVAAY